MHKNAKDLTGLKFGMLTVLKYLESRNSQSIFLAQCECGNVIEVRGGKLTSGDKYSCGCKRRAKTHQMSNTRLYHIWENMKRRCNAKAGTKEYKNYAGRGISYCKEWESFEPFMQWALNSGYSDDLQIDRIDNDGNYCPENCRWATWVENQRNRRVTTKITINGITKPLVEWCEENNININTVRGRLQRGWETSKAIMFPVNAVLREEMQV